jgi:hypothetical protein
MSSVSVPEEKSESQVQNPKYIWPSQALALPLEEKQTLSGPVSNFQSQPLDPSKIQSIHLYELPSFFLVH